MQIGGWRRVSTHWSKLLSDFVDLWSGRTEPWRDVEAFTPFFTNGIPGMMA